MLKEWDKILLEQRDWKSDFCCFIINVHDGKLNFCESSLFYETGNSSSILKKEQDDNVANG